jgi:hypothetical protein
MAKFIEGRRVRLKNRRVIVHKFDEGLSIKFVKLGGDPAEIVRQSERGIHSMAFSISYEAGLALWEMLGELIQLSDIEKP